MPSPQARIARAGVRVSGMLVSAYLPVKYQRFMLDNAAPSFFLGARSCGMRREEQCCVPAVWLDPRGADRDRVLLFLHGGGFVLGNIGSHRKMVSRLAEKAERDGSEVELEVWEDMWHDWHLFAPMVPESREAVRKIGRFLREKMG